MFTKAKDTAHREPALPPASSIARKAPRAAPSIVSADMTIVGAITAGGDIQVDGKVEGDIITDSLTVGENAVIKGEVLAEEVIVRGVVEGSIKAEKVQLCAGARVHGDILHSALAVESGALFEGNCRHSPDPLGRKAGKPAAESVARMETGPAAARADEAPRPAPARSEPAVTAPPRPAAPEQRPTAAKAPEAAASRPQKDNGNGQERKSSAADLGKISPGRMRPGAADPALNAKPK